MKYRDLQKLCGERGLKATGTKAVLIARLQGKTSTPKKKPTKPKKPNKPKTPAKKAKTPSRRESAGERRTPPRGRGAAIGRRLLGAAAGAARIAGAYGGEQAKKLYRRMVGGETPVAEAVPKRLHAALDAIALRAKNLEWMKRHEKQVMAMKIRDRFEYVATMTGVTYTMHQASAVCDYVTKELADALTHFKFNTAVRLDRRVQVDF